MPNTTFNPPSRTVPGTSTGTSGCGCGCSSCDTCDSLKCLCRPRFFAGQLVTDADFRRLDQYLVGKDRLHNRFLHGTGVVCGLEVVCNPCDDTVTVRPGYALGPCGEDIVVCGDTSVDVGSMIRAQRKANARACPPGSSGFTSTPNDCDALEQRWILGICYDEQPGRAVATLTPSGSSCNCGGSTGSCGCGGSRGSSGGGCSCGGGTSTSSHGGCGCNGTSVKPTPVGCEPTVICEGFRFTLTKEKPVRMVREPVGRVASRGASLYQPAAGAAGLATHQGALTEHVRQCLAMLTANVSSMPQDPTEADVITYCCQLKADLRYIIDSGNIHDCTLGQRLNAIVCPDAADKEAVTNAREAIRLMLTLTIDLYRECICSALLPPCPNECADGCVPIATLTVRSSDLRVLDVCNWSSREFAVTMPMLGYWLSWLPIGSSLRRVVSSLCCPPQRNAQFTLNDKLNVTHEMVAERTAKTTQSSSPAAGIAEPLRMAMEYAAHPSPLAGFEATVLQGIGATGTNGAELATPDELADPFAAVALSRLFGPAGLDLGSVLRDLPGTAAAQPAAAEPEHVARLTELEKAVESLQKTVRSQARTISTLRKGSRQ